MVYSVESEIEGAGSSDYGMVGVRMDEVTYWHIEGMLDPRAGAALFAELHPVEDDE